MPKLPFSQVHEHSYTESVIPSTCTERGYTLHVCECGKEYKDNYTPLAQHDFRPAGEVAPTCTEPGKRLFTCSVCGAKKEEPIPATGHKFSASEIMVHPGCRSEGVRRGKCTVCGEVKDEPIPAVGHSFGKWLEETKAGCETPGKEIIQCSVCGHTESRATPALGHDFSPWDPSGTDPNKDERFCRRCGISEEREGQDPQILYQAGMDALNRKAEDEALDNFRLAAQKGHPAAQYQYGRLLRKSRTAKDDKEGREWIKKAAEAGNADARFYLKSQSVIKGVALFFVIYFLVALLFSFVYGIVDTIQTAKEANASSGTITDDGWDSFDFDSL